MTLEIVVDELVVYGLSPASARVAASALEARLAALAAPDAELRARAESFRRLPDVDVRADAPAALGAAVAGSVWSSLAGGKK